VRQQICSRRPIQAPSSVFPPNKSAGLSARSCVTSQVHEEFLRAIFCPSRVSSQCFSQASGASRFQHRLSSVLLTKYGSRGCNAVGCANTNGHRPTNTRSFFSAPEAVLNEIEQRFYCVQAQTKYNRVWWGVFTLILNNRISLLQVQSHTHSTDRMLSPTEELRA